MSAKRALRESLWGEGRDYCGRGKEEMHWVSTYDEENHSLELDVSAENEN